jgi:hypothetical protein
MASLETAKNYIPKPQQSLKRTSVVLLGVVQGTEQGLAPVREHSQEPQDGTLGTVSPAVSHDCEVRLLLQLLMQLLPAMSILCGQLAVACCVGGSRQEAWPERLAEQVEVRVVQELQQHKHSKRT